MYVGQHPAFIFGPTGWWQHSQPACWDARVQGRGRRGTHVVMPSSGRPRLRGCQGRLQVSLSHQFPIHPAWHWVQSPPFPESHTTAHWPEILEPTARALHVSSSKPSCSAGGYHSPPPHRGMQVPEEAREPATVVQPQVGPRLRRRL